MSLLEAGRLEIPGRLRPSALALEAGTLACLIGPNGSGKTSLLHAIAGIGSPRGDVRIEGRVPAALRPRERQKLLGFLPASREVVWPLKAADVIALGHDRPVEAAVGAMEVESLLPRRMDRLSTGERSRVLLARVLASAPRLLLLDEPLANLDPLWQLRLMEYLQAMVQRTGQAVLMAVHDLDAARSHADRVIVIDRGRIVAEGPPDTVFGSEAIAAVFGVERVGSEWRPVRPREDPRSSP